MAERVPADQIERIVGVERKANEHWARAVSTEEMVYILHSQACLDSAIDLLECYYTRALVRGINVERWVLDEPVRVMVSFGELVPYEESEGDT